jgi:anti-sigma regulatory factor (Ser/Thr protein kinase)
MAGRERRVRLPGEIQQVRAACEFVVEVARDAGFGDDGIFQSQLAVEEIFTNIVEHGYQHNGSDKSIDIVTHINDEKMTISIIDEAQLFNPLQLNDPDPDSPLWERVNGGWGVYFVRQYMDDVRYTQQNNRNCIILEKKLPK